ncbi:BRCT domain-containing protein [Corynebacterium anserum]|uniref:BRCT domain-containing protein n=1 Tax=Corynebacterium anserum TaxID=2684406 RepID=UPI0028BE7B5F|nr:BRCT domain-containing protein [Corynebacterium anserum]
MIVALPARGAEVTITEEGVQITRSLLASSLLPDANIAASELLGWYFQQPDGLSPGYIELLTEHTRTRLNFSPTQLSQFAAINTRLTNLQAGYPLDNASGTAVGRATDSATAPHSGNSAEGSTRAEMPSERKATKTARRRAPWSKVATPDEIPEANKDADITNPIYGHNVTVTGDVEPYDKSAVWNMIAQAGGTVAKNVTKKTTMLIVGQWATMTSKEKRARELKDKGQDLTIITFDEFLAMVGENKL